MKQLCSAKRLECLELDSLSYNCFSDVDVFLEAMDFLFPTPNKETGIHHFSRLRCLKLWNFRVEEWPDVGDDVVSEEIRDRLPLFNDDKRIKICFPNLRGLALRYPTSNLAALESALLIARGSFLDSLHLCSHLVYDKAQLPSFNCLSELCLSGNASLQYLLWFCGKKEENEKHLSKLDKIFVNLGSVEFSSLSPILAIPDVMKLVLNPSRFEASKCIRLKLCIPSGWREENEINPASMRIFLNKIVQSIVSQSELNKGMRFESISFHLEVTMGIMFAPNFFATHGQR